MVYIVSTLLRKAMEHKEYNGTGKNNSNEAPINVAWKNLMLEPKDYSYSAIYNPLTRKIMDKIVFEHGGKAFDDKYPDGIPT
jgi:2-methylcitrate dehydratase